LLFFSFLFGIVPFTYDGLPHAGGDHLVLVVSLACALAEGVCWDMARDFHQAPMWTPSSSFIVAFILFTSFIYARTFGAEAPFFSFTKLCFIIWYLSLSFSR